jgi:hypothetical protein
VRRLSFPFAIIVLVAPMFAVSNAIPTVNQPLVPSSVTPASGTFQLGVNGTAFVPGAVVNWNGVPLSTTFVNRRRLRAVVPAADVTKAATATVSVTNPAPGGGTSNAVFFTVTTPTPSLTFAPGASLTVGTTVSQVAVADFNNDGKMDLAVLNQGAEYICTDGTVGSEYVSTFLGNGDGTFTAGGALQLDCVMLDAGSDYAITVADFNGDGSPDIAVSFTGSICCIDFGHWVAVYPGNGDGTFSAQPSEPFNVANGDGMPITGDFNGNGGMEVAIEGGDLGFILYVIPEYGIGGGETLLDLAIDGGGSSWLLAGDFNNDGILDMVSPPVNNLPTILLGNGDGTFTAASAQPTATFPNAPALGDFNGDGNLDLIVPGMVLLGNGDGTFSEKSEPNVSGNLVADLNGDGKLDVIGSVICLGNGDGTFQTGLDIGPSGTPVAVADFSGDGRLDLVMQDSTSPNTITLLLQSPAAIASPSILAFGKQAVGTTGATRLASLTNSGSAALHLSTIIASGDFTETNNCRAVIPIAQTCDINVVFKPTAKGVRTGNIAITDNAAGSRQTVKLTGTGD